MSRHLPYEEFWNVIRGSEMCKVLGGESLGLCGAESGPERLAVGRGAMAEARATSWACSVGLAGRGKGLGFHA